MKPGILNPISFFFRETLRKPNYCISKIKTQKRNEQGTKSHWFWNMENANITNVNKYHSRVSLFVLFVSINVPDN